MAADLPNCNLKTTLTLLRVRFQNYWIEISPIPTSFNSSMGIQCL